jgi:hypothetical protein
MGKANQTYKYCCVCPVEYTLSWQYDATDGDLACSKRRRGSKAAVPARVLLADERGAWAAEGGAAARGLPLAHAQGSAARGRPSGQRSLLRPRTARSPYGGAPCPPIV